MIQVREIEQTVLIFEAVVGKSGFLC